MTENNASGMEAAMRRYRRKNRLLLLVLVIIVAAIYALTMARMGAARP